VLDEWDRQASDGCHVLGHGGLVRAACLREQRHRREVQLRAEVDQHVETTDPGARNGGDGRQLLLLGVTLLLLLLLLAVRPLLLRLRLDVWLELTERRLLTVLAFLVRTLAVRPLLLPGLLLLLLSVLLPLAVLMLLAVPLLPIVLRRTCSSGRPLLLDISARGQEHVGDLLQRLRPLEVSEERAEKRRLLLHVRRDRLQRLLGLVVGVREHCC